MINIKFIKEELPIIWFLTGHNFRIAWCALPFIFLGINLLIPSIFIDYVNSDLQAHCELHKVQRCNLEIIKDPAYSPYIYKYILTLKTKLMITISSAIIVFLGIFYAHRSFLDNYLPKKFELKRASTIIKDFKFMCVWLLSSTLFNIPMIYFDVPSLLFKAISGYLVQNVIFYILIRKKHFGYDIKKRSSVIDA